MCTYRLTKEWVIIRCNQDWSQSCLLRNGCSKSRSRGHKGLPMNPHESRGASTSTFMTLQYRHIQSAYWVHTTCIDIKATTTRFMFTPKKNSKQNRQWPVQPIYLTIQWKTSATKVPSPPNHWESVWIHSADFQHWDLRGFVPAPPSSPNGAAHQLATKPLSLMDTNAFGETDCCH